MTSSFFPVSRRAGLLGSWLTLAVALALAGCRSGEQRAQLEEANADQLTAAANLPAAMAALGRATAADSNNVRLWLKLGHLQLQTGGLVAAQSSFQRAAELAPDDVDALENLTILAVRGEDLDDAKRFMEPLLLLQPNDPAGLLAKGAIALREHRPADAVVASEQLVVASPGLVETYILRARALAAAGRREEALVLLEQRSRIEPEGADRRQLLELLLDQYRAAGQVAGIRSTSLRLHAEDPAEPRYALESARALHAEGRDAEAAALLDDLQRRYPRTPALIGAIADYWRATLPPAAARDALLRMAGTASLVAKVALADRLVGMGASADALALLQPYARRRIGASTVDAATGYAGALVAAGRATEASALVGRVLAFDPANVPALLVRARLRMGRRQWSAAEADAQLAASGDPTNPAAALLLAQVYATEGSPVLAQQAYAQAVQAFPDDFAVLKAYSDWLLAAGRGGETLFQLAAFARAHRSYAPAWRQYARACAAAGDSCLAEARAGTGRLG